ncbi:MAG: prepilin-type N-terminal cleavage/methylation domain-containing protein [Armatimonadota bacterium]|nr:MAG: prepilin-type N-terminal cleavage/methylation domain-containing protein [Armatimonadota bacterium]
MHRTTSARDDRGMTLIELLLVIFIISVLAGAVVPVFYRAQSKSRETWCISNIHQILLGLQMYLIDYDSIPLDHAGQVVVDGEVINKGIQWTAAVLPYVGSEEVFLCPQDPTRGTKYPVRGIPTSFGYYYTRAAVELFHGEGRKLAGDSPIMGCFWHVRPSNVRVIGRMDGSIEVAPTGKYPRVNVVFE